MQDWLHWQDPILHRNRNSKNVGYASKSDCNSPEISVFSVQTIRDELHQRDADPRTESTFVREMDTGRNSGVGQSYFGCDSYNKVCSSGCGCSRGKTLNSPEKSTFLASLLPDTTKNCTSATGVGSLDSIMVPVV